MKWIALTLLILIAGCKKEDHEILDGTYTVMSSNHFPGTIEIAGNHIQFSGLGFGGYASTINRSDMNFTINKGAHIERGHGKVHDRQIDGFVQINYGQSGVSNFTFTGSK